MPAFMDTRNEICLLSEAREHLPEKQSKRHHAGRDKGCFTVSTHGFPIRASLHDVNLMVEGIEGYGMVERAGLCQFHVG